MVYAIFSEMILLSMNTDVKEKKLCWDPQPKISFQDSSYMLYQSSKLFS